MSTMVYKEENGEKYKISFSENLQMKNLKAVKENTSWQKKQFYAKIILLIVGLILLITLIYVFYKLDQVNFFSTIMYH